MSKFKKLNISGVRTIKTAGRETKADFSKFGQPFDPDKPLAEFLKSLPSFLKAEDLLSLAGRIAKSKIDGEKIIWMMGAHPIKVGLSPVINDMIDNGFVSHLAVNGACIIHDIEAAFFGRTSEDVSKGIADGSFGMVEETPRIISEAVSKADKEKLGLGECIGKYIEEKSPDFSDLSIFRKCYIKNIPVSAHVAIGTDTISQHPEFDAGKYGRLSGDDFLLLAESVSHLSGGVVLNFGSAVILPEVFLKALTVARNIKGKIENFDAANFDMIQHYRPNLNVVTRPVSGSGKGYAFTGHHEIMMPLLAAAIKCKYKEILEGL